MSSAATLHVYINISSEAEVKFETEFEFSI